MAGIEAVGAYVPLGRLSRAEWAAFWKKAAGRGERAVARFDEDTVTMAVAAVQDCLAGRTLPAGAALYFASTTPPYHEHQSAAIVAAAADLPEQVRTVDFGGSLRAGGDALLAAVDAVNAGSAPAAVVVAADMRLGFPGSEPEAGGGDAAAALLITPDGPIAIDATASYANPTLEFWRRAEERYLRVFDPRFANASGATPSVRAVSRLLFQRAGAEPAGVNRVAVAGVDARTQQGLAKTVGAGEAPSEDTLIGRVGFAGAAHSLLLLIAAIEAAEAGQRIAWVAEGDGAEAALLTVKAPLARPSRLQKEIERGAPVTYNDYARWRGVVPGEPTAPASSPLIEWREQAQDIRLHGSKCRACGTVQYPMARVCINCQARDQMDRVPLARRGTVFTFTVDELAADNNPGVGEGPVPMAVVDLEDGARIFVQVADLPPYDTRVGMEVELVFRRLHEGGDYINYYWKARPINPGG
jgi:3-hydroxy-3-methylglutaryl CoA synthase/uncharacterized OB-fold protein